MRSSFLAVVLLVAGCSSEDLPWRNNNGKGHTGGGDPVLDFDAGPDVDGGETFTLNGRVCVIEDWRTPFECLDLTLSHDVLVEDTATGGLSVFSDNSGEFALDIAATGTVVQVGGEIADLLQTTHGALSSLANPVDAPAVDQDLWETTLADLLETLTSGAIVVYVVDPDGPVSGATLTYVSSTPPGSRLYYDDGAGSFDLNAVATDIDGAVVLLDTVTSNLRATALDGRTSTVTAYTTIDAVGIATITLPAP